MEYYFSRTYICQFSDELLCREALLPYSQRSIFALFYSFAFDIKKFGFDISFSSESVDHPAIVFFAIKNTGNVILTNEDFIADQDRIIYIKNATILHTEARAYYDSRGKAFKRDRFIVELIINDDHIIIANFPSLAPGECVLLNIICNTENNYYDLIELQPGDVTANFFVRSSRSKPIMTLNYSPHYARRIFRYAWNDVVRWDQLAKVMAMSFMIGVALALFVEFGPPVMRRVRDLFGI